MKLRLIDGLFAVCRLNSVSDLDLTDDFWFLCRTDEELSLVCRDQSVPEGADRIERGWRMLGVEGELDFGLTGILARLSGLLAEAGVPIFAVSTYNTDYILVKAADLGRALTALRAGGCSVAEPSI